MMATAMTLNRPKLDFNLKTGDSLYFKLGEERTIKTISMPEYSERKFSIKNKDYKSITRRISTQ